MGPRVVKLLGSMVLSKPAAERENSILAMWHKIVNTLQDCALQPQPSQDHDYEGICIIYQLEPTVFWHGFIYFVIDLL